ncbi:Nodulation-signaling pathway protein isoform 2 [Quillaja saponaria]|uniref:Nodulation-signaling pathway protein isoform 2 n=2 Tax=Quillaja saponaria TaxID=32244 RepID=A0AAD7QB03_QUISA|nr:Nodulation-signaling pathway protein isoform 2 [Quillaja saponaria]
MQKCHLVYIRRSYNKFIHVKRRQETKIYSREKERTKFVRETVAMEMYGTVFRTVYRETKSGTGDLNRSSYSNFNKMEPQTDHLPQEVQEFITKLQTEVSRPANFSPLTSTTTDWGRSPQSTNGAAGHGGYNDNSNKEGHNQYPTGRAASNGGYSDYSNNEGQSPHSTGLGGPTGFGGYGNYRNKEGHNPRPTGVTGPAHNGGYSDYNKKEGQTPHPSGLGGTAGYGGYGDYSNKEGHNPRPTSLIGSAGNGDYRNKEGRNPRPNGLMDSTGNVGYGDYSNKGHTPPSMGGYGDYSNKEGHNPRPIGTTGYGYGDKMNKEGNNPRPTSTVGPTGYGDYSNKEGHNPRPIASTGYGYGDNINKEGNNPRRTSTVGPAGYGDYSNKEGHRPIGNSIRNNNYDETNRNNYMEPSVNTNGDMSNRPTWAAPQRKATPLSEPTNNIGTAMELLKQTASPPPITTAPPQIKYSTPIASPPIKDTHRETIDSREASRRYGGIFNFSPRPRNTGETDAGTIDSRTAVKKYGGTMLPGKE